MLLEALSIRFPTPKVYSLLRKKAIPNFLWNIYVCAITPLSRFAINKRRIFPADPTSSDQKQALAPLQKLAQYWERNRMEYHPEYNCANSEILLGLLGSDLLEARGWLQ